MASTLLSLMDRIRSEADAYRELERLRWNGRPVCAHCESENVAYMSPANGVSRKTRTGAASERRVWQCRDCRRQFSVTTGTVMHGSKIAIRVWLLVILEMCADKNGISAREVERKYGVCPRSAWHMLHRIREAMANGGPLSSMRGVVVADETWIGGKMGNKHAKDRPFTTEPTLVEPGEPRHSPGMGGKTSVLTLVSRETGESRSFVVADVTGKTLRKVIAEQVDMANTILHTDEGAGYKPLAAELAAHETVNHSEDEYVRYVDGRVITSNHAENFFSQLKRSLDGTHHHVSREHLHRYLAEFDYRYTTREITDAQRMARLVGRVGGRRLTYKRVAAS